MEKYIELEVYYKSKLLKLLEDTKQYAEGINDKATS
jgi:hypothetical protein